MAISTENDTIGAQAGLKIAIATPSHAPISARPPPARRPGCPVNRPMITTANTTPSQAQICDGASVEMSAMNRPATPA